MTEEIAIKQFAYDIKAEATASGYRIHAHAYGDVMDDVVVDIARMVSKTITEFEREGLPLAVNSARVLAK